MKAKVQGLTFQLVGIKGVDLLVCAEKTNIMGFSFTMGKRVKGPIYCFRGLVKWMINLVGILRGHGLFIVNFGSKRTFFFLGLKGIIQMGGNLWYFFILVLAVNLWDDKLQNMELNVSRLCYMPT